MCEAEAPALRSLLERMRELAPTIKGVETHFSEEALPAPAWLGVAYTPFDSLVLYTLVHDTKPKRFVEIGSGATTAMARRAALNAGHDMHITSIDPKPRASIDAICDVVIRDGLETLADLSVFDELEAGDIVFLDGSHRAFMNSDVTVFFIDVLPRLKPGVVVHVHDILLPWDYPSDMKHWHWNEAYMLAVYLMGARDRVSLIAPTAFMALGASLAALSEAPYVDLPDNRGWRFGGAMWFTHTA